VYIPGSSTLIVTLLKHEDAIMIRNRKPESTAAFPNISMELRLSYLLIKQQSKEL
jgi:hypothetical protein